MKRRSSRLAYEIDKEFRLRQAHKSEKYPNFENDECTEKEYQMQ